jgi:hypothetical protein
MYVGSRTPRLSFTKRHSLQSSHFPPAPYDQNGRFSTFLPYVRWVPGQPAEWICRGKSISAFHGPPIGQISAFYAASAFKGIVVYCVAFLCCSSGVCAFGKEVRQCVHRAAFALYCLIDSWRQFAFFKHGRNIFSHISLNFNIIELLTC